MNKHPYRQPMVGYASKHRSYKGRSQRKKYIFLGFLTVGFLLFAIAGGWFRANIINELPDIREIEDFNFKQSTTITDRNGTVLYRMFEENRQYIPYEEISPHFVNGLVATEDKRFWQNAGIDPIGMVRAAITDITQGKTHGASTLTQQLIKMIMLTPEKKIERKLKEIILAVKLNSYVKNDLNETTRGLSETEIDRKVKEKIMELYSNLIPLGNNAYGVEAAAQTYFSKSAKDLTILEAAILAGMPQAPSRYNPFTNRGLLMGQINVTDSVGNPVDITDFIRQQIISKAEININASQLENRRNDQAILTFLRSVLDISVQDESGNSYTVSYQLGRKDVVLARMYEERYITEFELKKAILDGFTFQFTRASTSIKAPHFVFWVISQLEQEYSLETLQKGGLTVVTSLDYTIQEMAEESMMENKEKLTTNGANNSSLVYIDSLNGDVLAYVGSLDFNDTDIDGQVDMIQSTRQSGSTMKPFVYALGFMRLPLTLDTPIYDLRLNIAGDEPNNADGRFGGLTTIRQALAGSRNLPAIKMFFDVGGESTFKPFLRSLGVGNLQEGESFYGYPLAIGAAEIKKIDLVNAYMHLSAMGKPAEIKPIIEIRGPNNNLLYRKEVTTQEQIIPYGVAYLMWRILSDNSNLPSDRVRQFTAPGRITMATKTGTSNIVRNNQRLPRDGWLMAYTPSKVIGLRGGNTDGRAMNSNAYGGWINSDMRKSFISKLVDGGYMQNETVPAMETTEVTISRISGKLMSAETPTAFAQKTLAYLQTAPTATDTSITQIQIDALCNGEPSELTPPQDLLTAYQITPESPMRDGRDLESIKEWWENDGLARFQEMIEAPLIINQLTGSCLEERQRLTLESDITLEILKPLAGEKVSRTFSLWHQSDSTNALRTVRILLGETEVGRLTYRRGGAINDISSVTIPEDIPVGNHTLRIIGIDDTGMSKTSSVQIELIDNDTTPPKLMDDRVHIEDKGDGVYGIALLFVDESSSISNGTIEQDGELVSSFSSDVAQFDVTDLSKELNRSVTDSSGNTATGTVDLTRYLIKTSE